MAVCCALMLWCLCTANQPVTPAGAPGHHAPPSMPMCCQKWETEQAQVNTKTVRQKRLTHIHHQKSRPESAFFKYLFVFNVFTSFNLLCKSEVLQAFQRPWPLDFFFFKLHFCSLSFERVRLVCLRTNLHRILSVHYCLLWGVCTLLT